jgi:hypothetical protein
MSLSQTTSDALARWREFDELEERVAAFGLELDEVRATISERWEANQIAATGERDQQVFARGFVEGLLAGVQASRGDRTSA